MQRILKWVKDEFFRVFPAFVFFFLAFNLVNFTEALMFRDAEVHRFTQLELFIGAGIVAKVLLVIDHLPKVDLFRGKPLIYNIAWKTALYGAASLLLRGLSVLYPFPLEEKLLGPTHYYAPRFWAVQIWFFALIFVFVISRELVRAIGRERMKRLLFGGK